MFTVELRFKSAQREVSLETFLEAFLQRAAEELRQEIQQGWVPASVFTC